MEPFVKNIPISAIKTTVADLALSKTWRAYPWRWTRAALTAIPLVDGTQDYSIDAGDTTFWNLLSARITRTDTTPDKYNEFSGIVEKLPPELDSKIGFGSFRLISHDKTLNKLRLEAAADEPSGVTLQIDGEYQKSPTKLTATTGTLDAPDYYFDSYTDWVLYYLYKFTDDSRAGTIVVNGRGQRQYTGQLAVAQDSLSEAMKAEDRANGQALIFPDEPLGTSLGTGVGILG